MERKKNVAEIKRLIQERKESLRSFSALVAFLWTKGVSRALSEEIALEMDHNDLSLLKHLIAKRLRTCGGFDLKEGEQTRIALVGPTGVGKSVALLKLVALYQNKRCGILTLDPSKRSLLECSKVPIARELEELVEAEVVFIDTPGCSFYELERVNEIGELLAPIPDVQSHLVLSATTKEVDLFGAIHQFSPLRINSLLFTKLDETLSAGVLVNISARVQMPISYIAFGYPLPGNIQVAQPEDIVHKILTDLNTEEFHFIRQINCQLNE